METNGEEKSFRPHILVIDDEQGFRDLLAYELGSRGYEIITASDGEEGVMKARSATVDVVVSDLTMPKMTGLEVIGRIKEIHPKCEIIIITGNATLQTAVDCMKKGAYDYLLKPFEMDHILRLIERAMDKRLLNQQVDKLEELNRMKSEFLANMSHELRTPMNAILGYTELMLNGVYGALGEDLRKALERVSANGRNLLQIINNILDLSKLAAGRMTIFTEDFLLSELVKEVIETMGSLARGKNLDLLWDVPANIRMNTDKTKLKQVLINLVGNGIKFTPRGSISVKGSLLPDGRKVEIKVKDTGIGIRPEEIPLIFQEFKQADATSTREHGGTGLGLAITEKFLSLMSGGIKVESEVGKGSTFILTVPLEPLSEPRTAFRSRAAAPEPSQKILLAIDDDPDVLNLIQDNLQGTGYFFVGALSGEDGVALARQYVPHVITLDIMMPRWDGWAILKLLKNDPILKSVPVVILSVVENKTLGFAMGVSDYLLKPFNRQDLLNSIRRVNEDALKKILVIDDDASTASLIQETLARSGRSVTVSDGHEDVVDRLNKEKPDILFLDIMMPHLNAFAILDAIEASTSLKAMPVFAITSKDLREEEIEILEKKVKAIIRKDPKTLSDILGLLRRKLASLNG